MKHGTKVATCCYCGTKAALVLRGEKRHELTCSSCGSPLRNMKFMPVSTQSVKKTQKPSYAPQKTKKSAKNTLNTNQKGNVNLWENVFSKTCLTYLMIFSIKPLVKHHFTP